VRETVAAKAHRLLASGQLTVTRVDGHRVSATCAGDTGRYTLSFERGEWSCSCPAYRDCSHLEALKLVTRQPERPA
jgi:hypothetical protein